MPERILNFREFSALAIQILAAGSTLRFRANGASMRPFIRDGEVVEIQAVEVPDLKQGDIVLCRLEQERIVLHRLMRIMETKEKRKFLIQGDSISLPDAVVCPEQILGRATAVYKNEKRIELNRPFISWFAFVWIWLAPVRPLLIDFWHLMRGNRK